MEMQGPRPVPVWAYLASFVVLGSSLSFAGPALSHLRDRVGTDDGGISLIFVGSSIGYMFGSFMGGRWLDRGRGHRMWAVCLVVSVVGIVVISQIRELVPLVAVFVVLGLAAALATSRATPWWCGAVRSRPGPRSTPCTCSLHSARCRRHC